MEQLAALLSSEYGICAARIAPAPGGFSAKAYSVQDTGGRAYFLKVYDSALPTTRFFVRRLDAYMPALHRLSSLPALTGRVLTPIPTKAAAYRVQAGRRVLALFAFVPGTVPGIEGMSRSQTAELGRLLADLHTASVPAPGLEEDITLPFLGRLSALLNTLGPENPLYPRLWPFRGTLLAAVDETLGLLASARRGHTPLVLCHGDAHGGNVIQSDRLVLADWEDLRMAPAEADLFIYAWHPHGDALLESYRAARPGFALHPGLLRFYVLRRRLEDVWVDIRRLTEESPPEAEARELEDWIDRGIEAVETALGTPENIF